MSEGHSTDEAPSETPVVVTVETAPAQSSTEVVAAETAVAVAEQAIALAGGVAVIAEQQAAEVIAENAETERTQDEQIKWLEGRVSILTTQVESLEQRQSQTALTATVAEVTAEVALETAEEVAEVLTPPASLEPLEPGQAVTTTTILEETTEPSSTTSEAVQESAAEEGAERHARAKRVRRFL